MTKPALRFALATGLFFSVASVDVGPDGVVVAAATAAKKKKKSDASAEASGKDDGKGDKKAEKKGDKKGSDAPREELRTTGPATIQRDAFSEKQFENSAKAERKRDEQIDEIKGLLGKLKPADERRGELVFRLAEIYWAKSKFIYQKEFKNFDDAYQKWVDNGRTGKEPQLASFTSESEAY